jgi:hypothetical protein
MAFSDRLANIQQSIQISERQARSPSITAVTEETKESWARFQTKIDEGYPVIFLDPAMLPNGVAPITTVDTGFRPEIFNALWTDYNKVEGEIYAMLGTMYNVEQNKAAGVGPAETMINYAQTFALANSRLEQRQVWCEKINQEFDFGIQCEKSNDIQDIIREMNAGAATPPSEKRAPKKDGEDDERDER